MGKDGGKGFGSFGADDVGWDFHFHVEHLPVEEQDGTEGLVLGGCGNPFFDGKVCKEGSYLFSAHVFGMAFVVEDDVTFDPLDVGLFCAVGVMFDANGVGDLLQELFPLW